MTISRQDLLFRLEDLSVSLSGEPVLKGIHLTVGKGEALVITGGSGSGKTTLAHTVAGRHFFHGGFAVGHGEVENFQRAVQVVEQQHRFRNRNLSADQYYQQRYNALNANETVTVREDLEDYEDGKWPFNKERLAGLFGVQALLEKPLIQLSNGENKRLQMVKALLLPHDLLILDQPFTGLDSAGRQSLAGVLVELWQAGESILLICGMRDIPPQFLRQVVIEDGRIVYDGPPAGSPRVQGSVFGAQPIPAPAGPAYPDFQYAFRLNKIDIRYDEKQILHDVSWSVKRGECWSLSGPNGAGKSTLLSLVTGDNPQAYANDILLFDRPRGSGESIWEIKQRVGMISPELHLFFDPSATVYAAIASGLFDTVGLFRTLSASQENVVSEWASFLGLGDQLRVLLNRLPAGRQRLVLLARALIKHPPLLILDEPCQGLDENDTEAVKELVDRYCAQETATLVYVSHYPEEWPACIRHSATLASGRISLKY